MNDPRDPLRPVLRAWQHEPPPAPGFQDAVWARIHAAEFAAAAPRLFQFPVSLPLAACLAILFAGAIGTSTALALNHAQATDRMAADYVRSIDPLQMVPAHSHP